MQIQIGTTYVATSDHDWFPYDKITIHSIYPYRTRTFKQHRRSWNDGYTFKDYLNVLFKRYELDDCETTRTHWFNEEPLRKRLNPFWLWIRFPREKETVTVTEYQAVATLDDEHSFEWAGLDTLGEALSYGHYRPIYRSGDEPHVLTFKTKEGQNIQ
jgi:hypothetical protein